MRSFDDCLQMVHSAASATRSANPAAEIAAAAEIYNTELILDRLAPVLNTILGVKNEAENFKEDINEEDFTVQLEDE